MKQVIRSKGQSHQQDAQSKGQSEVAATRLQHDGRRENPRLPFDIAADEHHRADLGDDAAERGDDGRQHGQPRFPDERPRCLRPRGSQ